MKHESWQLAVLCVLAHKFMLIIYIQFVLFLSDDRLIQHWLYKPIAVAATGAVHRVSYITYCTSRGYCRDITYFCERSWRHLGSPCCWSACGRCEIQEWGTEWTNKTVFEAEMTTCHCHITRNSIRSARLLPAFPDSRTAARSPYIYTQQPTDSDFRKTWL